MTENHFELPTYFVLNAPAPIAQAVKALRRRFDPERSEMPVEVTVAGSNGLGPLLADQSHEKVFEVFDQIVSNTPPINVRFGPMRFFPNTTIFFLDIVPIDDIWQLQQRFAQSTIRFAESPFHFEPHCTVKLRGDLSEKDTRDLLSFQLQSPNVTLDTMSVYNLDQTMLEPRLLHRANLGEAL
jgi:2'-5' RNA ligase